MKKVLYIASISRHILAFHLPYLKLLKENGYEVHVATNDDVEIPNCDQHHIVPFARSPFSKNNLKAYQALSKLSKEEQFDLVICNTPVASALTRKVFQKQRKNGVRVIYFAHGFHFCKGVPLKNWLIFYPMEKHFSRMTDDLITINEEDFEIAKKKLKAVHVHHIHGVGIDINQFTNRLSKEEKNSFRQGLGLSPEDFIIFFAGELNDNKNQIAIVEALKTLIPQHPNIKLLLAGDGPRKAYLEQKIKDYQLENHVYILGYRNDIYELLSISDLYVSMSKREGLPVNIMEARSMNLPIVASDNRGQKELIADGENGFIVNTSDIESLKNKIELLYSNQELRSKFSSHARDDLEKYSIENVYQEVKAIYLN